MAYGGEKDDGEMSSLSNNKFLIISSNKHKKGMTHQSRGLQQRSLPWWKFYIQIAFHSVLVSWNMIHWCSDPNDKSREFCWAFFIAIAFLRCFAPFSVCLRSQREPARWRNTNTKGNFFHFTFRSFFSPIFLGARFGFVSVSGGFWNYFQMPRGKFEGYITQACLKWSGKW